MKKRCLTTLLVLVMCLTLLPAVALAASGGVGGGSVSGGGGSSESDVDASQVCMVVETEIWNAGPYTSGRLLANFLHMDGSTEIATVSKIHVMEDGELVPKAVVSEVTDPTCQIDCAAAQSALTGEQDAEALTKFFSYDITSDGYELTELNAANYAGRWEDPCSRSNNGEVFATIFPQAVFASELGGDGTLAEWPITANMKTTFVVGRADGNTGNVTYSAYQGFRDIPIVDACRITAICENYGSDGLSYTNTVARFVYLEYLPAIREEGDFLIEDYTTLVEYIGSGGDVVIPNGVTRIGDSAFWKCEALTGVTIPDSVTTIGSGAFSECENLTNVTIPSSVTTIEGEAFGDTPWLKNMGEFPVVNGILLAYQGEGGNVTVPDGVTYIGEYSFSGCASLTNLTIPGSVVRIGRSAFSECTGLTDVMIQNGCKRIGSEAFYECKALTRVTIPDSVTAMGTNMFAGRYGENVGMGGGFQNCPDGMTVYGEAGSYAERYCRNQNIPFAILAGTARAGALESDSGKSVSWDVTAEGQVAVNVETASLTPDEAVLVACYDSQGRFTGVKVLDAQHAAAQIDPSTSNVKLYWLGAAQQPQSPSVTVWGK